MSLKKVIANKHPLVEVLGPVMEFCQAKEIINLYFLLNKEVNKQALEILGFINRPFESQLKKVNPFEATAILRFSEQFLKDNGFVDEDKKINVNMKIKKSGEDQSAIDVALLPDIPNNRLILEGLFCRGFDLNLIGNQKDVAVKLIEFKIFKVAFEIVMNLIGKNEFQETSTIGFKLAKNGGVKEAYCIALELIRKDKSNQVFIIAHLLAEMGAIEEAYNICIELIKNNETRGIGNIRLYLDKNKEHSIAYEIDLKLINKQFEGNSIGFELAREQAAKSVYYNAKKLIKNKEYNKAEIIANVLHKNGEEEKANKITCQINNRNNANSQSSCTIS